MKRICWTFLCSVSIVSAQWTDAYIADFKVNDDNLNSYQILSSIGTDSAGNFIIAWTDSRMWPGSNYPWQVYCQRYTRDGNPIGVNFRIGQDTASAPEIAMMPEGRFVVVWATYPLGLSRIDLSYQRFDRNANPLKSAGTGNRFYSVLLPGILDWN
jgi:hypothetical protein